MLQNLHGYLLKIGAWRKWLARLSDTEKVEGSSPSAPTLLKFIMCVCDKLKEEISPNKPFVEVSVQEIPKTYWYKFVMIKWNETEFDFGYEDYDNAVEIPIQYCPFCGRKLSEE